jgi:hypothetical protein
MMRLRAVRSLLVEEVGGIAASRSRRWSRREPEESEERTPEERDEFLRGELELASRKALGMVVLCWTAIPVLFLTHENPDRFLSFHGIETVFTLGILVVATYAGFRLGQWEKYRAVTRAVEELDEREGEG